MLKQMQTIEILARNIQTAVAELKTQYESFSAAFSGEKATVTMAKTSTSRSDAMKRAWAKRRANAKKAAPKIVKVAKKVKAAPKAKIDRSAAMKLAWAKRRANAAKATKAAPKAKDHRSNGGSASTVATTPDASMQV